MSDKTSEQEFIEWLQKEAIRAHLSGTFWCCMACANALCVVALSLAVFFLVSK